MRSFILCLGLALCACDASNAPERSGHDESTAPPVPEERPTIPPVESLADGIWMKGDLHVHSRHSKDSTNNPVSKIVGLAERVGMDYLLISDHDNHVDGNVAQNTWADPEYRSTSVLLLYGAEWTTHRGHGTALAARPYDHQRLYDVRDQRDVSIAAVKKALGIHLSANHPGGSDHFGFSYDMVDSIEVWNSAIWATNASALLIWDDMLKSGRRIAARGGSDSHHGYPDAPGQEAAVNNIQAPANNVGTPTTWVFGSARNSDAVVKALSAGRSSVSANPNAPRVEFYADLDQDGTMDMMMGDNLRATGQPVRFTVRLVGRGAVPLPYIVKVTKDGSEFGSFPTSGTTPTVEFVDTPAADARSYYRVEVTGAPAEYPEVPFSTVLSGSMIGLSSPLYFNYDPAF